MFKVEHKSINDDSCDKFNLQCHLTTSLLLSLYAYVLFEIVVLIIILMSLVKVLFARTFIK